MKIAIVTGATKSFVLSYSRAMNPGWVKTEFFDHAFQTNGDGEVQFFNRLYEARDMVATGLKDLYKSRKDFSVHGLPVQAQILGVKFLPHRFVMNIRQNQQKKPKNNQGLTTSGKQTAALPVFGSAAFILFTRLT
jgi:short-subunit dehydrogenase